MFASLYEKYWKNPATQGTVIVTAGLMVANVINYIFQSLMGRMLSPADFGTMNSLLSLSVILGVPAGILSASLIKVSSELLAKYDFKKLTYLFWKLAVYAMTFGVFVFLVFLVFKSPIANYLNITDTQLLITFGVFMGLSLVRVIPFAYLQGLLRFKGFAFSVSMQSIFRLVLPIGLLLLGFGLKGVFTGLVLTGIFSLFLSTAVLNKNLTNFEKLDLSTYYKKILIFSIPVFFIQFGMQALNNVDVIMVKKFFEPDMAGYYAGVVTLGKIFLFGAGTVVTVMFPLVSSTYSKGEDTKKVFTQFLSIQLLIVFAGLFVYNLLPRFLTLVFFGTGLLHSVEYLPRFSFFVALYTLNNFMVMYSLAIERTKVFMLFIPALVMQFILLNIFHSTLIQVINVNIAISAGLLVAMYIFTKKASLKIT